MTDDRNRDEVDAIIAAWHRERPDLDTSPLEVLSRISRLSHRLAVLRQRVFTQCGLEAWEFDVLAALRRSGAPYALPAGQLSAETLVTSGTMTNRIDRLAARDLVRRMRSATDRRGVSVQLTELGRERVDAAFSALVGAERELLDGVSPDDRARLAELLRSLSLTLG